MDGFPLPEQSSRCPHADRPLITNYDAEGRIFTNIGPSIININPHGNQSKLQGNGTSMRGELTLAHSPCFHITCGQQKQTLSNHNPL